MGPESGRSGDLQPCVDLALPAHLVMMTSRLSRKESVGLWLHRNLDKRFSRLSVALFRRTKGGITERVNVDALVLTTVGRKSGRRRRVLLQYFRDGDDMLLVAADGGSDRHPGWFHNLMADPDAEAEMRGQAVLVHATKLYQTEAEDAWPAILARSPDYERYLRATERSIPIVRLTRHMPRPQMSDRDAAMLVEAPPSPRAEPDEASAAMLPPVTRRGGGYPLPP